MLFKRRGRLSWRAELAWLHSYRQAGVNRALRERTCANPSNNSLCGGHGVGTRAGCCCVATPLLCIGGGGGGVVPHFG
jgi:hypothetical protein